MLASDPSRTDDKTLLLSVTTNQLICWAVKGFPSVCQTAAQDLVAFCLEQIALRSQTIFALNSKLEIEGYGAFPSQILSQFSKCLGPIESDLRPQIKRELAPIIFSFLPQYLDINKPYTVGKTTYHLNFQILSPYKLSLRFIPTSDIAVAMTADTAFFTSGQNIIAVERDCALIS